MDRFTDVNKAVANADTARELILTDRNLRTLPKQIASLVNLEVLDISTNELRKLPFWLFKFKKLRILNISCTFIHQIPDAIGDLTALEELYLGGFDKFTQLPETLGKLTNLRILDLSDANGLITLPACLSSMTAIEELHLVRTSDLVNVNDVITKLPKLRKLVMDDISLTSFTIKPESWNGLQSLTIARTQITYLPDWIGSLQELQELYLDSNSNLAEFPVEIGNLPSLRVLNIELNKPLAFPHFFGKLTHLERLKLTRFGFTEIPNWIFELSGLKFLSLGLNPIEYVSYDISRLTLLERLYFGYNPKLVSQREQIEAWLPNCKVDLTPAATITTSSPIVSSIATENTTSIYTTNLAFMTSRDYSGAVAWPELSSIEIWISLNEMKKNAVAQDLAKTMGPHVRVLKPMGNHQFPRLVDTSSGLVFIAIAGGTFFMGLRKAEKQALTKLTKKWSEESQMHVHELQNIASPSHEVTVPAFLCLEMPITSANAMDRITTILNRDDVRLFDPSMAMSYAKRSDSRLLTEAEWEYVARQGGSRSWLMINQDQLNHDDPEFAMHTLAKEPADGEDDMFGIRGLGWGTWVEDGWHNSYEGAPVDGSSWEPAELPEMGRCGAFLSWPWQIDGEALLLHVAHRERLFNRHFPLLFARDLPANR